VGDVERRYANVRSALARDGLDAALICGSEYSGFEGAVTYMSGFTIVHRYAYVLLPVDGEPAIVFPTEARYVGEHGTSWIDEQVFADRPGEVARRHAQRQAGRRVRPRLRHDGARLRRAARQGRARAVGRASSTMRAR
jgi:Creatinase/Prolidase N-terminal domain.